MGRKAEEFFIFAIPSPNSNADFYTLGVLHDVNLYMGKGKAAISTDKFGVLAARTHILELLKDRMDKLGIEYGEYVRMLWVDSDIRINTPANELAERFKKADELGLNLIADYITPWQNGGFAHTISKPNDKGKYTTLTDEELNSFSDMQELPKGYVGGLGFYYGLVPIDYKFHNEEFGEDITFYRDMYARLPDYRLALAKIDIKHKKEVLL